MADAKHTHVLGENEPKSETPVMALHRNWQAYRAWLDGPACKDMDDTDYDLHVAALTRMEQRITRTPSFSAKDLAAQIEVMTGNWQDDGCEDAVRALVTRTAIHQGMGVAA